MQRLPVAMCTLMTLSLRTWPSATGTWAVFRTRWARCLSGCLRLRPMSIRNLVFLTQSAMLNSKLRFFVAEAAQDLSFQCMFVAARIKSEAQPKFCEGILMTFSEATQAPVNAAQ